MQLICPHCGKPVPAEHINIQRMVAVCPACDTVFQFDAPNSKIKRRKVKQPQHVLSDEANGHLSLAFRTNFRLDKNQAFLISTAAGVFFTFITFLMIGQTPAKPQTPLIIAFFSLIMLLFYYSAALVAYNKTHIDIDDEQISVSRKPLPNPLRQPTTVDLSGIARVRYEETPTSQKEGYDTPRYNVWAEMVDGNPRLIVGDVVEDYAVFISQRLNDFLDLDAAPDVTHLLDDEGEAGSEDTIEALAPKSRSSLT